MVVRSNGFANITDLEQRILKIQASLPSEISSVELEKIVLTLIEINKGKK